MSYRDQVRRRAARRAAFDQDLIRIHGLSLTGVGEEDEVVIVGHVDDWRRIVAAVNAFTRRIYSMPMAKLVGDDVTVEWVLSHTRRTWAVMALSCKTSSTPEHPQDCGQCRQIQAADWWLRYASQDARGAFPITLWSPHG